MCPKPVELVGMMASVAVRCSSRWITVVVSSGPRRAPGLALSSDHIGVCRFSTIGVGKLWHGGSVVCGGEGKALTLRGLSGEWCINQAKLS